MNNLVYFNNYQFFEIAQINPLILKYVAWHFYLFMQEINMVGILHGGMLTDIDIKPFAFI